MALLYQQCDRHEKPAQTEMVSGRVIVANGIWTGLLVLNMLSINTVHSRRCARAFGACLSGLRRPGDRRPRLRLL